MPLSLGRQPLWRFALWGGVAAILMAPLIAMQLTREVNWTATDFLFAGVLLGGAAAALELTLWRVRTPRTRLLIGGAILGVVLLVWAQGAVGIL